MILAGHVPEKKDYLTIRHMGSKVEVPKGLLLCNTKAKKKNTIVSRNAGDKKNFDQAGCKLIFF